MLPLPTPVLRVVLALTLAGLAAAALPPAARAGIYTVRQCDTGIPSPVGSDWAGSQSGSGAYTRLDSCSSQRLLNLRGSGTIGANASASWSLDAPAGTAIDNYEIHCQSNAGAYPFGAALVQAYAGAVVAKSTFCHSTAGYVQADYHGGTATRVMLTLRCASSEGCIWAGGPYLNATNLEYGLNDLEAPSMPTASGELLEGGWQRGLQQLSYSAADRGGGVRRADLSVGGPGGATQSQIQPCSADDGFWNRAVPCPRSASGQITLDTARLADGEHALALSVTDVGGRTGAALEQTVLVDNSAPEAPLGARVAPGGWSQANGFDLAWSNPGQGNGSPVAGARYKLGTPPTSPEDGTTVSEAGLSSIASVRAPGDGDHPLYLWLVDEAGNADPSRAALLRLRLDTGAPTVTFHDELDREAPARLRAAASDAVSGVAGGTIAYRRRGGEDWHPLPTRVDGGDLVADLPDDRLTPGAYELRATAVDRAGNSASTTRRGDGTAMVVSAPLRVETRLEGGLVRHRRGHTLLVRRLTVAHGRGATVRGRLLASETQPLEGAAVTVQERAPGASTWRPLAALATGAGGRFSFALGPGPSRELRLAYAGTPRRLPATAGLVLRVRGRATLSAVPRRLHNGGRVRLRGRVLGSAGRGKLVVVQFLDRRGGARWRPVLSVRTRRRGSFSASYRFRSVRSAARVAFRAFVPAERGWPYAGGASRTLRVSVSP